jgi:hypothetical protein
LGKWDTLISSLKDLPHSFLMSLSKCFGRSYPERTLPRRGESAEDHNTFEYWTGDLCAVHFHLPSFNAYFKLLFHILLLKMPNVGSNRLPECAARRGPKRAASGKSG